MKKYLLIVVIAFFGFSRESLAFSAPQEVKITGPSTLVQGGSVSNFKAGITGVRLDEDYAGVTNFQLKWEFLGQTNTTTTLSNTPVPGISGEASYLYNRNYSASNSTSLGNKTMKVTVTWTWSNGTNASLTDTHIVNITPKPPKPDLTISSNTTTSGLVPEGGGNISWDFYVDNIGGASSSSFNVGIWLSTNTTFSPSSDLLLGESGVSSLNAGSSIHINGSIATNSGVHNPGVFHILLVADDHFEIDEITDSNNVIASSEIEITAAGSRMGSTELSTLKTMDISELENNVLSEKELISVIDLSGKIIWDKKNNSLDFRSFPTHRILVFNYFLNGNIESEKIYIE